MAEPLKYMFNEKIIKTLSQQVSQVYRNFDEQAFYNAVFSFNWDNMELKERMNHISITLHNFLPDNYEVSIEILKKISNKFDGFIHMFFPAYVELFGIDHYEVSVEALEFFTKSSSSEFAVRPFIIKYPQKMMAQMSTWADSENHHVRRLASEGCRPRLPWAMALPEFKKDPSPILPILEKLKNDKSEYVRRSVANNLNDISKDHRQIVFDIADRWLGENEQTDKIIKHACRSLLKKGDKEILTLFGYSDPDHINIEKFYVDESVKMGDSLNFSFNITSDEKELGKLRIEYIMDFMKSNGKMAGKVFKISEAVFAGNKKTIEKNHSFRKITTRTYYCGEHGISIIINGVPFARKSFQLKK